MRTKANIINTAFYTYASCNCNTMYSSYSAIPKRNAFQVSVTIELDRSCGAIEGDQSALPVLRLKVTSPARSSNLQIDSNAIENGAALACGVLPSHSNTKKCLEARAGSHSQV